MKVTKLIREYVEEEVGKVYNAKVNPYSEQAELDRQKIKEFGDELRNKQKEMIEQFISETELFESTWSSGMRPYQIRTSTPSFSHLYTRAMFDEKEWNEENNQAKKAKVREIIISLELGATKNELNAMIAKLTEE